MNKISESDYELEYCDSNFKSYEFKATVYGADVGFKVLGMGGSLFIWIGNASNVLSNMSVSMPTRFQPMPLVSNIFGSSSDLTSTTLAAKLAKKLNTQVFLSCNLSDFKVLVEVERILFEEIKNNEFFSKYLQTERVKA